MRPCHFQDRPGRASLCLRPLLEGAEVCALRLCTERRMERCHVRNWELDVRMAVRATAGPHLSACPCGRRHDRLEDSIMCAVAPVLRELRSRPPAPAPEGTDEEPFPVPRDIGKRLWPRLRAIALVRDGHLCRACGRDLTALPAWYTEVHHIRPRVEGGSDHPANLATLCVECHGELTDGLRRRMRSTAAIAGPGPF